MKKLIYTALMMATIVGCQEVIEELQPAENAKVYKAEIEACADLTKTSMTDTKEVVWTEGDQIALFQGLTTASIYQVKSECAGQTEGLFTSVSSSTSGTAIPHNVALYPYAESLSVEDISGEDSEIRTYEISGYTLPEIQTYSANTFGKAAFPMVAVADANSETFQFKNLLGAMKLELKGTETVKSITITGNKEEKLSGDVIISAYSKTFAPDFSFTENAKTSVTLDCGAGVKLNETTATTFIIALPPVTFTEGFTVTITDDKDETKTFQTIISNNVRRSTILAMPARGTEDEEINLEKLAITFGDPVETRTTIKVPVSTPDAARIYYVFDADVIPTKVVKTEKKRLDYILTYGSYINASSFDALDEKVNPNTPRSLMAVAMDAAGRFGAVSFINTIKTKPLVFNDLTVTIEDGEIADKKASFPITISGGTATDVLFWVGKSTDEFWRLAKYCNGQAQYGEKYMTLYPEDSNIQKAMSAHTYQNGRLSLSGLSADKEYIILFMAKDATGEYSHAGYKKFTTMAANLGTIVRTGTDTWNAAKNKIQIKWHTEKFRVKPSQSLFAFYAFDFSCPTDLTAYVYCLSEDYYYGSSSPFTKVEDIILDVEAYCSRRYHSGTVRTGANGEYAQEPDWVDDNGEVHTGTLLNVYDFYVHGFPRSGFATYFATGSHGANNCTCWETDCTEYQYALNSIRNYCSLDYWKDYVRTHRSNYCTKEEVINKCATDLYNAYYPYYKDAKPLIYENNGATLYMEHHEASGPDDNGVVIDDVIVVLKDMNGNYYEPMIFQVPNAFK